MLLSQFEQFLWNITVNRRTICRCSSYSSSITVKNYDNFWSYDTIKVHEEQTTVAAAADRKERHNAWHPFHKQDCENICSFIAI